MIRLPPRSTPTDTLFPHTTLVRTIRTDLVFLLARHEHRSALELRGHLLAKVEFRMADHLVGADGHHSEMEHMQTHAGDTRIVERRCKTGDHAVPVHVARLERLMVGRGAGPPPVDVLAKGQPLATVGIAGMTGRNQISIPHRTVDTAQPAL